jgi:hypothetical protein
MAAGSRDLTGEYDGEEAAHSLQGPPPPYGAALSMEGEKRGETYGERPTGDRSTFRHARSWLYRICDVHGLHAGRRGDDPPHSANKLLIDRGPHRYIEARDMDDTRVRRRYGGLRGACKRPPCRYERTPTRLGLQLVTEGSPWRPGEGRNTPGARPPQLYPQGRGQG